MFYVIIYSFNFRVNHLHGSVIQCFSISLLQAILEYNSERRDDTYCFIDEGLSDAKVLQGLHKMSGHLVEMRFVKAHGEKAIMLRLHVRTNIHVSWDAIGKRQAHKLFLVRLEHVQGHTDEESLKIFVDDKSCVELVDRRLERRLSANSLEEMGLLLILFLLLFFVLFGVGSSLFKDGPKRRDDADGFVDQFLFNAHAVERGDEMSRHGIEMELI